MALPPIPQRVEGMTPEQELQQWAQWRLNVSPYGDLSKLPQAQKDAIQAQFEQMTPEQVRYFNGPSPRPGDPKFDQMYGTDMFSPEAGQTYVNAKTHFNAQTGQSEKNKSGWDLPETKLIVAMAAGFGGAVAGPAIAGALASHGGAAALAPEIATTSSGAATGVALPSAAALSAGAGGTATTAASVAGAGSTLSKAAKLFGGKKGEDLLGAAGSGIGAATNAAANNRLTSAELAQRAQNSNVAAQSNFENELMARAREEDAQRKEALKNISAASFAHNRVPGPNNTAGLTKYSPEYLASIDALASQGGSTLSKVAKYDANGLPELKPQTVDVEEFMKKYGQPSTMEKVGNWLSPTLSTLGKVSRYF